MKYLLKNIYYKYYQSVFYSSIIKNRIIDAEKFLEKKDIKKKSILFWTTHKCASTFIARALRQIAKNSDYKYFDYASNIWFLGDSLKIKEPFRIERECLFLYKEYGEIYGPLRTPFKVKDQENYINIFFLRDPRDLLVSDFYSKSISHEIPSNKFLKRKFLKQRESSLKIGIDQFCLENSERVITLYKRYQEMKISCPDSYFFNYEYFFDNPSSFLKELCDLINSSVDQEFINFLTTKAVTPFRERKIFFRTKKITHCRSGKNRQFENELKKETLEKINNKLYEVLTFWKFNI